MYFCLCAGPGAHLVGIVLRELEQEGVQRVGYGAAFATSQPLLPLDPSAALVCERARVRRRVSLSVRSCTRVFW